MNENLTELVSVVDMSGSMQQIREDAVGGFNQFVADQKKAPGEARFTAVFFDSNRYMKWQDGINIKECPILGEEYQPGAMTPLLDSVGRTIVDIGEKLKAEPEAARPGKVVFVIITDGLENASSEFNRKRIAEMIKHQEDVYKWEFVFLGANIDSFGEAGQMGMKTQNIANFKGSKKGVRAAYRVMSANVSSYRGGATGMSLGRDIDEDE